IVPRPGERVDLQKYDPGDTSGFSKAQARGEIPGLRMRLNELQDVLYANAGFALLVVLQGIDTAGKDSTIKSVFREVGPIGCEVVAFRVPTPEEAGHDYLWRYER